MKTVLLLIASNVFMTTSWYWHLKYRHETMWKVILISWGLAFFEYALQVPANRIGSYTFTAAQLKVIQEVIALSIFAVFSVVYLKQEIKWNYIVAFALMGAAVWVMFKFD